MRHIALDLEGDDRYIRAVAVRDLVSSIKSRGAAVYIDEGGERFYFTPPQEMTPSLRASLVEYKPEILQLLSRCRHSDDIEFGLLTYEGDSLVLRTRDDEDAFVFARSLGGKSARAKARSASEQAYAIPLRLDTISPVINFCLDNGVEMDRSAVETCYEIVSRGIESLKSSRAEASDFDVPGLGRTLRPFQRAGVEYAVHRRKCLIADEMGLGKGGQGLAAVYHLDAYPSIVVCPASLKLNLAKEATAWVPSKSVTVIDKLKRPFRVTIDGVSRVVTRNDWSADIIVINYDMLDKLSEKLLRVRPRSIVFDESHYLKNRKAQRTVAAKKIAADVPVKLMLSGTPIMNAPIELAPQLEILGVLNEHFGDYWKFAKRFCGAYKDNFGWHFNGAANLDELNNILRATCMIRRTKDSVLTELPPKQIVEIPIQIDNAKEYEKAEADVAAWLADQKVKEEGFLNAIAGLPEEQRQARIAERRAGAEHRARQAEKLVRIETLKKIAVEGKKKAVQDWIDDFLRTGEKLVFFGHHVDVVKGFAVKYGSPHITGDCSVTARQAAVDAFQTDPDCRFISLNLQAGGVGLTLTASSTVAFIEFGWTPAIMDQAADRVHRIGQKEYVVIYYFVANGTIDEDILALIERKRKVFAGACQGDAASNILDDLADKILQSRKISGRK